VKNRRIKSATQDHDGGFGRIMLRPYNAAAKI
jgi:hypothetical protein